LPATVGCVSLKDTQGNRLQALHNSAPIASSQVDPDQPGVTAAVDGFSRPSAERREYSFAPRSTAAPNTASMLVPVVGVGVRRIATVYRHEDAFVHWKTSWNRV